MHAHAYTGLIFEGTYTNAHGVKLYTLTPSMLYILASVRNSHPTARTARLGGLGMQGGKAWVRRAYSVALTGCGTASCVL